MRGESTAGPTAIIGGGWAGLACGVELAAAGVPVTLFESAKHLGGRARSVDWHGLPIDNGQHLMVGAYRATENLLRRLNPDSSLGGAIAPAQASGGCFAAILGACSSAIAGLWPPPNRPNCLANPLAIHLRPNELSGLNTDHLLERRTLDLRLPGFRLALPRLPAPLHLAAGLLTAEGLTWGEKLAAARFIQSLKRSHFQLPQDLPAALFLRDQPVALVENLWAPLCIAALNTPLETASSQVFCHVLRDSLMGQRGDSDLVFNRVDLGRLLPEAATAFIEAHGGEVHLAHRIAGIRIDGQGLRLEGWDESFAEVVIATHPAHAAALTTAFPALAGVRAQLAAFTWQPIATLWLRFETPSETPSAFPFPMLGLGPGQAPWAFERNDLAPGVVAIVESADGPHLHQPAEALRDSYLQKLAQAIGPLPPLLDWKLIVEKRATWACTPGLARPVNATAQPGLYLAGDYTDGPYPATLEGAVRSGLECAARVLAGCCPS